MSLPRRQSVPVPKIADAFEGLRSDYNAAKTGRFRRRRKGLAASGSGADYHYRSEGDFLRMMEIARDMARNDAVIGQAIDRSVYNEVQAGFVLDPQSGDPGVDEALYLAWDAWSKDPGQCDLAGERDFVEMTEVVSRSVKIDGDILALPIDDGSVELVEAHRCRTPDNTKRNVVHGVMLDANTRRRIEYWFTNEDIGPDAILGRVSDVRRVPAYDGDGERNVLHIADPKRATQTRGISALAPVFDVAGMFEDINFAKLVQAQVVSCVTFLRERTADYRPAGIAPASDQMQVLHGADRIVNDFAPAMEIRGEKGETIKGFSPNVPNAEFFEHVKLMLSLLGVNLGMPLVLLMMDARETNFSGWRAAMDQAKMGFRRNQRLLVRRWASPIYRWKALQFAQEDRTLGRALTKLGREAFLRHEFRTPSWTYIQPLQDAQANDVRLKGRQVSPRKLAAEIGTEHETVIDHIVEDNAYTIRKAVEAAKKIQTDTGVAVDWHELLYIPISEKSSPAPGAPAPGAAGATPPRAPVEDDKPKKPGDTDQPPADDDVTDDADEEAELEVSAR